MEDIVKFDVGGCMYTTTRSTLTRYPGSMLAAIVSGELDPSVRDANGAYIIDGDGPIFRHILNFLRRGELILPEDFKEWDLLRKEADFYQMPYLTKAVSLRKQSEFADAQSRKDYDYELLRQPVPVPDNPKMEFVEFIEQDNKSYRYRGSWETLKQLPHEFIDVFEADPSFAQFKESAFPDNAPRLRSLEDMRSIVQRCGEITGYWGAFTLEQPGQVHRRPDQNPPNWMVVFRQTTELGFQLLSTSARNGEKSWLFGKQVYSYIL